MQRTTTRRRKRLGAVVAVAAAAAVSIGLMAPPASADATGDATGLQASLIQLLGPVINIPPIPHITSPPGGTLNVLGLNVIPGISAGVLNVASNATAGGVASSASVANAQVLTVVQDASVIASNCTSDASGQTGNANVVGANVLGIPVVVAAGPNTSLLGLATLNEQTRTADGITVRAIHVNLPIVGELIVSESSCAGANGSGTGTRARSLAASATAENPNLTG